MFWLGIHHAEWLGRTSVPTMVSFRSLFRRRRLPRAAGAWVQDSGGFNELALHGCHTTIPDAYAARTRIHAEQIGGMQWAAVQDWMCEEVMLARTGLTVMQHQRKTVESYLDLRELAPDLPWLPVLQGQALDEYRRHLDMYADAGVDLRLAPLVGVGTLCRRQHTMAAVRLLQGLKALGLRLHGFGLKITSVLRLRDVLVSSDSMSWSLDGRYPQGGRCRKRHRSCANCLDYALLWREKLLARLDQPMLPGFA
jgi:hypothetical protein